LDFCERLGEKLRCVERGVVFLVDVRDFEVYFDPPFEVFGGQKDDIGLETRDLVVEVIDGDYGVDGFAEDAAEFEGVERCVVD
jgi:hypothetical protein